ncbi:MAG: FAD-dependent thymidylate synthase, partial [Chryseobacterium sp.]
LHFLALRCDPHAQWEIRVFADAMLELVKPIVPWAIEAWEDYHEHRGAMRLTRLEVEALSKSLQGTKVSKIDSDNKREQEEWVQKMKILGLTIE